MSIEQAGPTAIEPDSRDAVIAHLRRQLVGRDASIRQLSAERQTLLADRAGVQAALRVARADVVRWKFAAGASGALSFIAGRVMR